MKLTPDDLAYLKQRANALGYNPDDLLKVINYESSGDPSRWGGKDNNYFGLIQFGPNERKQFGVDTENPSAINQIDATFKYLNARGYKAGMPLVDLYSTINAGSPGHYNASDGSGTVVSHVANMSGLPTSFQPTQLTGSIQPNQHDVVGEAPQSLLSPADQDDKDGARVTKIANSLLAPQQQNEIFDAPQPLPMMEMPQAQAHLPDQNLLMKIRKRGLLG